MCGNCNVWGCVCLAFVICGCVYVLELKCFGLCMCGLCKVWVGVCVSFVICVYVYVWLL